MLAAVVPPSTPTKVLLPMPVLPLGSVAYMTSWFTPLITEAPQPSYGFPGARASYKFWALIPRKGYPRLLVTPSAWTFRYGTFRKPAQLRSPLQSRDYHSMEHSIYTKYELPEVLTPKIVLPAPIMAPCPSAVIHSDANEASNGIKLTLRACFL